MTQGYASPLAVLEALLLVEDVGKLTGRRERPNLGQSQTSTTIILELFQVFVFFSFRVHR